VGADITSWRDLTQETLMLHEKISGGGKYIQERTQMFQAGCGNFFFNVLVTRQGRWEEIDRVINPSARDQCGI
jgi:hypothetical protein